MCVKISTMPPSKTRSQSVQRSSCITYIMIIAAAQCSPRTRAVYVDTNNRAIYNYYTSIKIGMAVTKSRVVVIEN